MVKIGQRWKLHLSGKTIEILDVADSGWVLVRYASRRTGRHLIKSILHCCSLESGDEDGGLTPMRPAASRQAQKPAPAPPAMPERALRLAPLWPGWGDGDG